MSDAVFDETTLEAEIIRVWGRYGAHRDVFCEMKRRLTAAEAERDAESALADQLAEAMLNTFHPPHCACLTSMDNDCNCGRNGALAAWRTARKDQP